MISKHHSYRVQRKVPVKSQLPTITVTPKPIAILTSMWHPREDLVFYIHSHPALSKTLKISYFILAYPLMIGCYYCICAAKCLDRRNTGDFEYPTRQQQIRKLCKISQRRRERRLRKPRRDLSVGDNRQLRARDQDQSPLFTKLPAELRVVVYEMVLCGGRGGRMHLFRSGRNEMDSADLMSSVCTHADENVCSCLQDLEDGKTQASGSNLALLLTCRKIYREAINILYAKNTSIFPSVFDFTIFNHSILPHRLNQIKKIRISDDCYTLAHGFSKNSRICIGSDFRYEFLWQCWTLPARPTLSSMASLESVELVFHPTMRLVETIDLGDLLVLLTHFESCARSAATAVGFRVALFIVPERKDWQEFPDVLRPYPKGECIELC